MNHALRARAHLLVRQHPHCDGDITVKATDYRLVVRGELGPRFAYFFNGMAMTRGEGMTVLQGHVRDQAQLHGFIARIQELGLELVSVEQTAEALKEDT